jgi:SNF2 family DNA or RNA helicase
MTQQIQAFKPTDKQIQGASFLIKRNAALLTFSMGTGKSLIMILVALKLLKMEACRNVFLVLTKGSLPEVVEDFKKFSSYSPYLFSENDIQGVKKLKGKIILIQYEKLKGIEDGEIPYIFLNSACIFDEIQKLKCPTSQLTQTWNKVRPYLVRVYGCTGTAMTSKLDDLYWITHYINPTLLPTYWQFRSRYFVIRMKQVTRARKVQEVVGYKNLSELHEQLQDFMLSYYPEMDIRFISAYKEISDPVLYRQAAEGLLESGDPKSWVARMFDLQRLVDGDRNKLQVLAEEVKNRLASGVIIYAGYYDAMAKIEGVLDKLKISHKAITGRMATKDRLESKDWFNAEPCGKVLIISNAGSSSINIQATNELILFNIPVGIGLFMQACGRIARMNSKYKHFNVVFVGLKNSIDEYKAKYVQMNETVIKKLFNCEIVPPLQESMHSYLKQEFKRKLLWRNSK